MRLIQMAGLTILLLLACVRPEAHRESLPVELTVVSWNVENLFDTISEPGIQDGDFTPLGRYQWDLARYQLKLEHIWKVLHLINGKQLPDLVALQEIENRQVLEDLLAQAGLPPGYYSILHSDSPDERGIDVALLWDSRLMTCKRSTNLTVVLPSGDSTRNILWAEMQLQDGTLLSVYVNHWPSRRGGPDKRLSAARTLWQHYRTLAAGQPVLVLGDFNDEINDISLQSLFSNIPGLSEPELSGLPGSHPVPGSYYYSRQKKWYRLDHILTVNLSAEMIKTYACFSPEWLLTMDPSPRPFSTYAGTAYLGGYSDHLPLILKLSIPGPRGSDRSGEVADQ